MISKNRDAGFACPRRIITLFALFAMLSTLTFCSTNAKKDAAVQPEKATPLYVVDGKEITATAFKAIDPNTIESITVWKNANATERFGSKGVNGVIDIKTKTTSKHQ
jgi:hypothetical protein